jgi:hypothetical protein
MLRFVDSQTILSSAHPGKPRDDVVGPQLDDQGMPWCAALPVLVAEIYVSGRHLCGQIGEVKKWESLLSKLSQYSTNDHVLQMTFVLKTAGR